MAQIATAPPTPAEIGAWQGLSAGGQVMISDVALTGSSQFTQSVETYQILWNDYRDVINQVLVRAGHSPSWFRLEEDGGYGKNTALTLGIVLLALGGGQAGFRSAPPLKAAGVPVWYAQNMDAVNAMAPMNISADEMPLVNDLTSSPVHDQEVAQDVVERAQSGALVTDLVNGDDRAPAAPMLNPVCPPGTELPPGCGWNSPTEWGCPGNTTAEQLRAAGCYEASEQPVQPGPMDPVFEEEGGVKVVATPTRGLTPLIAVLFGAAAIGGWWFWRRPRRRRAA